MTDIQTMFHQVRVSKEHIDYLRFLWWPNGDTSQPPVEHRMLVHLFGAVSSPSCANFALRQTAEDNKDMFNPNIISTVNTNFYVDDCLKSLPSEQEAVQLVTELTSLCQKGGFRLTKWMSNSRTVLGHIPKEDRASEVRELDLDRDKLPIERALGLLWSVEDDMFKFNIIVKDKPHTRRNMLSIVSSIYDPLGFLCPLTLPAKLLLQALCRSKHDWDGRIPQAASEKWRRWIEDLSVLEDFEVARCMKPHGFETVRQAELHHFADASEHGYGTVSYLRITNDSGDIHVSFMTGKARVAPMKQMTIPRLELAAAVLAVKVDKMLRKEMEVLYSILKEQHLDDEGLQTLLCEVEAILNSRPITTVTEDERDLEALTPNHILLLKAQPAYPPGLFQKTDLYIRRRGGQTATYDGVVTRPRRCRGARRNSH
ncbi:uncharacterized protein LOC134462993 [Engraulis encrasicolus]|uniref:uncharacterized protein LOC134462993 n=1 Tax=Engraulis encrasicolus TaxID=184585 RepID=UPI002FD1BB05